MYILTAEELSQGNNGLKASGACGTEPQESFNSIQNLMRTRVEEALEIMTLSRLEFRDTFQVTGNYTIARNLRLANAFLTADAVVIKDADGVVVEVTALVDRYNGVVTAPLYAGQYTVTYISGFTAEEGTNVFIGVPEWMKSIALSTMFLWLRAMFRTGGSKDTSHSALTQGMIRELHARVYARYMRPRNGHDFPLISENRAVAVDPEEPGEWKQW